jgi:hypothetical protein
VESWSATRSVLEVGAPDVFDCVPSRADDADTCCRASFVCELPILMGREEWAVVEEMEIDRPHQGIMLTWASIRRLLR